MDDLVKRLRGNHCPDNYGCNALPKCACADLADAADAIERLSARIAQLESGQPVEVRGHVVKMQLVPVALHVDMIEAWSELAFQRIRNPDANKGFEASMHETYREILAASAAMFTASAQENSHE